MYSECLLLCGMDVVATGTVDDAIAHAPDADVIVTGILVSGSFDGIELIRRLRENDRTKDKTLIVLTAVTLAEERERAAQAGCDLFLTKPCLPDALITEVRRAHLLRSVSRPQPLRAESLRNTDRPKIA